MSHPLVIQECRHLDDLRRRLDKVSADLSCFFEQDSEMTSHPALFNPTQEAIRHIEAAARNAFLRNEEINREVRHHEKLGALLDDDLGTFTTVRDKIQRINGFLMDSGIKTTMRNILERRASQEEIIGFQSNIRQLNESLDRISPSKRNLRDEEASSASKRSRSEPIEHQMSHLGLSGTGDVTVSPYKRSSHDGEAGASAADGASDSESSGGEESSQAKRFR